MLPISNQTNKFILLSVLCCSGLEGFGNEVGKRDVPGGAAALPAPEPEGGGSIMGGKSGHGEDNRRGRGQITSPTPVDPKGSAD